MRIHRRLLPIVLTALLALALGASIATALRSIEFRGLEAGSRVQASSRLTFAETGLGNATKIICNITLLRTVSRIIPKIAGTLFGRITGYAIDRGETARREGEARSPNCRGNEVLRNVNDVVALEDARRPGRHREAGAGILLWDLPFSPLWKLVYDSFQGTLPRIDGINFHINGWHWLLIIEGIACLYRGTAFGLISITRATSAVAGASAVLSRTALEGEGNGILCPRRSTFDGSFVVSPTITITLL